MPTTEPLTVSWKRPEDELPEDGDYVLFAERESTEETPNTGVAYFEYTDDDNDPWRFMDLVHDEAIDVLVWTPLPELDTEQVERATYKSLRARERAEASS